MDQTSLDHADVQCTDLQTRSLVDRAVTRR